MAQVVSYTVTPRLPERLERLRDIAFNMYWCWQTEAIELFFRIDRELWDETNQNPVLLLGRVSQQRLEELAQDAGYLSQLDQVAARMDEYMAADIWRDNNPRTPEGFNVAYLSAEFGVHESISIYSGGLGVLAGNHLESASDLGLPLAGLGLLYREGYHTQYLNADGWQQELYPANDFYNMALTPERDSDGRHVKVEVDYPDRKVYARIWRCQVGRVPLYLMDCDFDENDPEDRELTGQLYGGDRDMRIRQEIMLGMGGVKALHACGVHPAIFHMNEGHSAFMALQRIRGLMQNEGLTWGHALETVKAASVFTTHTPVPAGNDMFSPEMMTHYFDKYAKDVGITMEELLALGRQDPADTREPFCMTVLALKLSSAANGVSELHGEVARGMWARTWRDVPQEEVPITSITNGVHPRFWISRDLAGLLDRYIGPPWVENPTDPEVWKHIDEVPDAELWRTHERRRERLVNFARKRLVSQLRYRGAPNSEVELASEVLDPEYLTIGFARRFATYKRGNLILMDPERFRRILTNPDRPVQFIISGKAHPQDHQGKEVIRNIIHYLRNYDVRSHIVFVEDYDINVARYMVQGVDCWLNTPRRPLEASGTSGMKVAANGGLNISVPDGWWCEAEGLAENGWSIGRGESYEDPDEQDLVESEALYEILEAEVAPIFYERGRESVPRQWVRRMKAAMRSINPIFNTHRMVQEYADRFYLPAATRRLELRADNRARSKALADWKRKVRQAWSDVAISNIESGATENIQFGETLTVQADVTLKALTPDDVTVEVYYGDLDPEGRILNGRTAEMNSVDGGPKGATRYEGHIPCEKTGQQGFMVRVVPSHPDLANKHETRLITWG
ncbi:MAG: alpha-glucan family phosphorylase [Candidatus Hydrogenedentota bacterium]